jgi:hypothetical protein
MYGFPEKQGLSIDAALVYTALFDSLPSFYGSYIFSDFSGIESLRGDFPGNHFPSGAGSLLCQHRWQWSIHLLAHIPVFQACQTKVNMWSCFN